MRCLSVALTLVSLACSATEAAHDGGPDARAASDMGGVGDLAEITYARHACATTGTACDCATNAACRSTDGDAAVILPLASVQERSIEVGFTLPTLDVLFLIATTGSMGGTID